MILDIQRTVMFRGVFERLLMSQNKYQWGKYMKNVLIAVVALLVVLIGIKVIGASPSHASTKIFQYKGSYIGDNSADMNVVMQLPQGKLFKSFSLETKKKPYGMTLNYSDVQSPIKPLVVHNATYMFTLIKNASWVKFVFPNEKYTLTRKQMQQWYGKDLRSITNQKALDKLIKANVKNKSKVDQLFKSEN